MTTKRWAVAFPADQTITYLTPDYKETTRHPEAGLWWTPEEADAARKAYEGDAENGWLEEVSDASEFRAREDTW